MSSHYDVTNPALADFFFRRPETSDVAHIAFWMAESTGLPPVWMEVLERRLLQQLTDPELVGHDFSWVGTAGGERICYLEHFPGDDIYLVIAPAWTRRRGMVPAIWERVLAHLRTIDKL